ncbi:MAG: hypothetical protein OSJ68_01740, partial [Clostridia bacterium]|nr:hypothetical protein [Clostridia bacterium]
SANAQDFMGGTHRNVLQIHSDAARTQELYRRDNFTDMQYFTLSDGTYYAHFCKQTYFAFVGWVGVEYAQFSFTVDTKNPQNTIKHNGTTNWLQGGANTNGNILLSASDTNFEKWVYSYNTTLSRISYDYVKANASWTFANNKASDGFKDGYYSFASMDNSARLSDFFYCYLDRTSPNTNCAVDNNGLTNKTFTLTAKDDGCGIKNIYFTSRFSFGEYSP